MKPVKLGIIGCGIAARDLHWPALKELPDQFEIVAVCNHTEPKAKEFSRMVGNVPYVLDYKKVLAMPEVEAVDIILPIELNCQVVTEVAKAGKHILVEKPLAANLREAENLVALEKGYNKVTMVAEHFRYRSIFRQIKSYIAAGEIGSPYAAFWNSFGFVDENNKYAQTKWRIQHQYPGGFVTDSGVHNIAALRDLFGDVTGIGSFTKTVNRAVGEVDSFSMQFTTPCQVSGVINIFFSVNGFSENRLMILGKEGSIIAEDNLLTLKRNHQIDITEKFEHDDGYQEEFQAFYQAIRSGQKVKSTFDEAYRDLKVIIDALNSAIK
jgi:predicted dehydrogenase